MVNKHLLGPKEIATYIDHTFLRAEATEEDIRKLCREAQNYNFAAVCVNPIYVRLAKQILNNTTIKVCSVAGFPLGAHLTEIKAREANKAIEDGADEIDMVIQIGALKSGNNEKVLDDIKRVTEVCHHGNAICKVIIETAFLTDEEKVRACQIAIKAGADFVKTSTGFSSKGASVEDVLLMKKAVVGCEVKVKASGGIRSYADALRMIEAGASRIGTSAGVKIVEEAATVVNSRAV